MPQKQLADYELLVSFAGPKALRATGRKFKVSTGAIRVLNAVVYRDSKRLFTSSAHLQAAKTATEPLLRANIAELIHAGLLQRSDSRHWLRVTIEGLSAASYFGRELRGAMRALDLA